MKFYILAVWPPKPVLLYHIKLIRLVFIKTEKAVDRKNNEEQCCDHNVEDL